MMRANTSRILIDFEKVDSNGEIRKKFTQDEIHERLRVISRLIVLEKEAMGDFMRAFYKIDLYTPKKDIISTAWHWDFEGENPMEMPIPRWRDYALLGTYGCGKTTFSYVMALRYAINYGFLPYYVRSADIMSKEGSKQGWTEMTKRAKFLIIDELGLDDSPTEYKEQRTRAILGDILKARLNNKNRLLREGRPNPITILISNYALEGERVAPVLEGTLGGVFTKLKFIRKNHRKIEIPDEKSKSPMKKFRKKMKFYIKTLKNSEKK